MSDRFQFRVWDKENKRWVKYFSISWRGAVLRDGNVTFIGEDFVIQECTGLQDKNGELIFEGDIVMCSMFSTTKSGTCDPNNEHLYITRGEIKYWRPSFYIEAHSKDGRPYITPQSEREIIGNIFETPELMKTE